jgi:hypothetical protein
MVFVITENYPKNPSIISVALPKEQIISAMIESYGVAL